VEQWDTAAAGSGAVEAEASVDIHLQDQCLPDQPLQFTHYVNCEVNYTALFARISNTLKFCLPFSKQMLEILVHHISHTQYMFIDM